MNRQFAGCVSVLLIFFICNNIITNIKYKSSKNNGLNSLTYTNSSDVSDVRELSNGEKTISTEGLYVNSISENVSSNPLISSGIFEGYREKSDWQQPKIPTQGTFAWIGINGIPLIKTSAPGKPNLVLNGKKYEPHDEYEKHIVTLALDDYYDFSKIRLTFSTSQTYDYTIQTSEDGLMWYIVSLKTITRGNNIVIADVFEIYRKYIRVLLNTDTTINELKSIEAYATKSLATSSVSKGPLINGVVTPLVMPIPVKIAGAVSTKIDLSGEWWFYDKPETDFYKKNKIPSQYAPVTVPGYPSVCLGKMISSDTETAFMRNFEVPEDAKGQRVILRFESVVDVARVWVNGFLAGTHIGGYGTFDMDITAYIKYGNDNLLTVGVTKIEVMPTFGYLGITGPVQLIFVQDQYINKFNVSTDFNASYSDATINITSSVVFGFANVVTTELTLTDPYKKIVQIKNPIVKYEKWNNLTAIAVTNPYKWDAEHPRLYTLTVVLKADGQAVAVYSFSIGFREVEIQGKELLVNGTPIVMRGVNWININPTAGYTFDYDSDKESLIKLKQANVNMIRTSHHPQYEAILALCDELGIYVELEAGPHIVTKWAQTYYERYDSLSNKKYDAWWSTLYSEQVERGRSHASVLYYSISNESDWGNNLENGVKYIRATDPTRPIKASWGYSPPLGLVDILSAHYSDMPDNTTKPTIWDEYSHLYTNNQFRLEADPGLRGAYGSYIQMNFEKVWRTPGTIGAAIWQARDWTLMSPLGVWQPFQTTWGLLDIWNREKPEYYDVKKAYSPVKMEEFETLAVPDTGKQLRLVVENRYSFTPLSELIVRWTVANEYGIIALSDYKPGVTGAFYLPSRNWKNGEVLKIEFIRHDFEVVKDYIVDTYSYTMGGIQAPTYQEKSNTAPVLSTSNNIIQINGDGFSISFDKTTGKIINGIYNGELLITSGPDLNLGIDVKTGEWSLKDISFFTNSSEVIIKVNGCYTIAGDVLFTIKIDGSGRIDLGYDFVMPMVDNIGEIGVVFEMTADIDKISWERRMDLWSYYPETSINRLSGTAMKLRIGGSEIYRKSPSWSWAQDEVQYRLGRSFTSNSTADFRSSKVNAYIGIVSSLMGNGLKAELDGHGSVRACVDNNGKVLFYINSEWARLGVGEFSTAQDLLPRQKGNAISDRVVVRFIK